MWPIIWITHILVWGLYIKQNSLLTKNLNAGAKDILGGISTTEKETVGDSEGSTSSVPIKNYAFDLGNTTKAKGSDGIDSDIASGDYVRRTKTAISDLQSNQMEQNILSHGPKTGDQGAEHPRVKHVQLYPNLDDLCSSAHRSTSTENECRNTSRPSQEKGTMHASRESLRKVCNSVSRFSEQTNTRPEDNEYGNRSSRSEHTEMDTEPPFKHEYDPQSRFSKNSSRTLVTKRHPEDNAYGNRSSRSEHTEMDTEPPFKHEYDPQSRFSEHSSERNSTKRHPEDNEYGKRSSRSEHTRMTTETPFRRDNVSQSRLSQDMYDSQSRLQPNLSDVDIAKRHPEDKEYGKRSSRSGQRGIARQPNQEPSSSYSDDVSSTKSYEEGSLERMHRFQNTAEEHIHNDFATDETRSVKLKTEPFAGLDDIFRQEISCDPETDYHVLGHVALLPSKYKFRGVTVCLKKIEDGTLIVQGNVREEVFKIVNDINNILHSSSGSSSHHTQRTVKHENRDTGATRSSLSRESLMSNASDRSDTYRTTYSDNFKPPQGRFGPAKSEFASRKDYGSSVDGAPHQANTTGFLTEYGKTRVQVMEANITTLRVDAIVNAANGSLKHGGGVAKAIADKAGHQFKRECENYIKGVGKIPVTGVFVSSGGNLPAQYVIHAVGPKWSRYGEDKREECARDLRRTVLRCLLEASHRCLGSIAIPSISAAIFRVPLPICTKAYLEAVKTFDKYTEIYGTSGLEEIWFVDITENMVKSIHDYFRSNWNCQLPSNQIAEDLDFALQQGEEMKQMIRKEKGKHSNTMELSSKSDYPSVKQREATSQDRLKSYPNRPLQMPPSIDLSTEFPYSVGDVRLGVTTQPAMQQSPDLIVIVGRLFKNLHKDPLFDPQDLPTNSNYPYRKNSFVFLAGVSSFPLLLQLALEGFHQEGINQAFRTLQDVTASPSSLLAMTQSLVFTSPVLYSSDFSAGAYPRDVAEKLVGAFTRNVYEFLKKLADAPTTGHITATIAAGPDVLPTIKKVLDSRQAEVKNPSKSGDSISEKKRPTAECGVCFEEKNKRHLLTCCDGSLCTICFQKVERCPFCRKPFNRLKGNQPKGRMDVKLERNIKLKGHEKYSSFKITYTFPRGQQEADHPNPGKYYEKVMREAYLPASEEGTKVLRLLRVAFRRRLTFTIGDSLTTGKKGVIIWNDIHHKTSPKEGSAHGYPDPDYLSNVTSELAGRGVTEASMSEDEKKDAMILHGKLKTSGYFLDF
ncbi:hypothetical protein EGW08_003198 [Elysia chlorotica]|uniref:RING-type E3 ubiquitin transferase n=1 Tax=Elysia chlorotica TaxID=188477 RepID=A0A433U5D3_ELYCH|nr:hypothetical protein EGW08_003198 [Elysia chlorotica]